MPPNDSWQWRMPNEAPPDQSANEFPPPPEETPTREMSRRGFLGWMSAASAALAGAGCTGQPREKIVPYVRQPEYMVPGEPLHFATAMQLGGEVRGLLVESREGRPVKIEGNPEHPLSLGRSNIHMQAELLQLYDPDRSQTVLNRESPATWSNFYQALLDQQSAWKKQGRVRLLTRRNASPTLQNQIETFLERYPGAVWHQHDPIFPPEHRHTPENILEAETLITFEAELFGPGGWNLAATRAFADRRRGRMNRLYTLESVPTLTGSMADHRRSLSPPELLQAAKQLADALESGTDPDDPWLAAAAHDLRGSIACAAASPYQPQALQMEVSRINHTLGHHPSPIRPQENAASLDELLTAIAAGEVDAVIILGANPVAESTNPQEVRTAFEKVPFTLHHGLYHDETAQACQWHLPASHFLESWGDLSEQGLLSIVQPLILPLYATQSEQELMARMNGETVTDGYTLLRNAWRDRFDSEDFELFWKYTLHNGFARVAPGDESRPNHNGAATPDDSLEPDHYHLLVRPDPNLLEGRYANNGWLQELPRPFTKLTWENAAHLSPATAKQAGVKHGQYVLLRTAQGVVRAPVWILPGMAEKSILVHLGYGRERAGRVGTGAGFSVNSLAGPAPSSTRQVQLQPLEDFHEFATTQEHQRMEGREPVRTYNAGEPEEEFNRHDTHLSSLYPKWEYERPAWGMVIDLRTCIGCAACTIACQAENNIPVVGREEVIAGREMHWIRVDRYFQGPQENPRMLQQPVPCMHCEKAPCEPVCPTAATVHDHEGLNVMVYNRCIGTRYCSNNCPYKVRRFNFFDYNKPNSPTKKMMRNPEVTVRMRGVMEKCTYCVQRISQARIDSKREERDIADGEVVTACQQACPADAIIFGDIHDPSSQVAKLREHPYHYTLLEEVNARPRTTYLARKMNPNPELLDG